MLDSAMSLPGKLVLLPRESGRLLSSAVCGALSGSAGSGKGPADNSALQELSAWQMLQQMDPSSMLWGLKGTWSGWQGDGSSFCSSLGFILALEVPEPPYN